jgi:hypothetical protein
MDLSITDAASSGILLLITLGLWLLFMAGSRPANFPSGPSGFPINGNLHQIPRGLPFLALEDWSEKYGPIV